MLNIIAVHVERSVPLYVPFCEYKIGWYLNLFHEMREKKN